VLQKEQITEMRGAVRFPLRLPIEVKAQDGQHHAETDNISAGGVLFHLDADVAVGSIVEFTIAMPAAVLGSSTDVMVSGSARVVRCDSEGPRHAVAAVIDEYHFERP
jgi:hypothetical protein